MKRRFSSTASGGWPRVLSVLALLTLHLVVCSAKDQISPVYRLPSTVTPLNYMLRLEPDLDNNTVSGVVMIELVTAKNGTDSMNNITLHLGADSRINETNVLLIDSIGVFVKNLSIVYNKDDTLVEVVLPSGSSLAYNRVYMLSLPFTSPLYDEAIGLFSGYFNSTSKYVGSNFRATFARNVFPCFDEPQFQVPLTLQVLRPASYNVSFTTGLYSSVAGDNDTVLDTFKPTGNMSLSSLGLFMSQVTPVTGMGLSLYAPSGYNTSIPFLEYLLSNITTTLGAFPTPNTLNLIVLPDRLFKSFSSLGFVFTTPEVYNDGVEAELQQQALRQQLAEAFLQQYLAFTKTPSWWSDLWLSDSFAAFLAIQMLPKAPLEGLEIVEIRSKGLNSDFTSCSRPVVNSQLLARLDIESVLVNQTIKNKGLSILTMWQDTLPEGLLNQTILDFIQLNKSLTTTSDFLELLIDNINNSTATYNVTAIENYLSTWLYTSGNPVVTLMSQNTTSSITISQSSDCSNLTSSSWSISISYTNNSSTNWTNIRQGLWLLNNTLTIPSNSSGWTILNLENAPYMVNYGSSYKQILSALAATNSSSIPADVRASIQADAIALALAGSLDFDTALSVLNSTQHDQVDWVPVVSALDILSALIGTNELGLEAFGMYVETLFSTNLLGALDLRNSSNNSDQWLARELLTPTLCLFNISTCRTAVLELSQDLLSGLLYNIDPNDVDNVACLGGRYNTSAVDVLLAGYTYAATLADQRLFIIALGCTIDSGSVQKILSVVNGSSSSIQNSTAVTRLTADNSSSGFTVRDIRDILVGLASSVENSEVLVDFIVSEAVNLEAMIGSGYLSDVIKSLANSRANLTKLKSLMDMNLCAYTFQSVEEAVSKANSTSTWWSSYGQALLKSLPQVASTASSSTEAPSTSTTKAATNTTAATTTNNTSTAKPASTAAPSNSASHFTSLQMVSLIVATVFVISINF